jgi:hypothetical protein
VTAEPHMKEMPVTDHGDFMVRAWGPSIELL